MIEFLIHDSGAAFSDFLLVRISDGKFTCQYWNHDGDFTRTTTRQELTLDKRVYRKGDVIKGRIDFECVSKVYDPKDLERPGHYPLNCSVFGVFKTIVE